MFFLLVYIFFFWVLLAFSEERQIILFADEVKRIKEEFADLVLSCLGMVNTLEIDLTITILGKIKQNRTKYLVDTYRVKAFLS